VSQGGRESRRTTNRLCRTRHEAVAALDQLRADTRDGLRLPSLDLGTYLRSWLDDTARPNVSPNTYRGYRAVLGHLEPIAHIPLVELAAEDIERCLNGMTAQRHRQVKDPTPASPKTVRNVQVMLRVALAHAEQRGHVRRNVARLVKLRRVPTVRREGMTPETARAILDAVSGDRYEAGYVLGFAGLRASEVLGLAWSDIDWAAGTVDVRHQLAGSGVSAVRVQPKSLASSAPVVLPASVLELLRAHQHRQRQERIAAGVETEEGLVFLTLAGVAVNLSWYSKHFRALVVAAGLPPMSVHQLRHGTATLLAALGVHPSVAQAILRHASPDTTLSVYTHVTSDLQRIAIEKVDRAIREVS
jgi:integrase